MIIFIGDFRIEGSHALEVTIYSQLALFYVCGTYIYYFLVEFLLNVRKCHH